MKTGVERIAAERQRQIKEEGYTAAHDAKHADESMAMAAACYAAPDLIFSHSQVGNSHGFIDPWPWRGSWDKRGQVGHIRQLEFAGALIAAEIDRLIAAGKDKP